MWKFDNDFKLKSDSIKAIINKIVIPYIKNKIFLVFDLFKNI